MLKTSCLLTTGASSIGQKRNLEIDGVRYCGRDDDCKAFEHCDQEFAIGGVGPGECQLTWWFILIIVAIALSIVVGIVSCLCCPCCCLYGVVKRILCCR